MTEQLKTAIVDKLKRVLNHINALEWWLVQPYQRDFLVEAAFDVRRCIQDVEVARDEG